MKAVKTFKTKIGAKFAILLSRIKNKFNGSKLVVEEYGISYNIITKEYTVTCNTMTEEQDKEFTKLITSVMAKISNIPQRVDVASPETESANVAEQKAKEQKWAEDVERNRQKQLAENKTKKSTKAPTKTKKQAKVKVSNVKNKTKE